MHVTSLQARMNLFFQSAVYLLVHACTHMLRLSLNERVNSNLAVAAFHRCNIACSFELSTLQPTSSSKLHLLLYKFADLLAIRPIQHLSILLYTKMDTLAPTERQEVNMAEVHIRVYVRQDLLIYANILIDFIS